MKMGPTDRTGIVVASYTTAAGERAKLRVLVPFSALQELDPGVYAPLNVLSARKDLGWTRRTTGDGTPGVRTITPAPYIEDLGDRLNAAILRHAAMPRNTCKPTFELPALDTITAAGRPPFHTYDVVLYGMMSVFIEPRSTDYGAPPMRLSVRRVAYTIDDDERSARRCQLLVLVHDMRATPAELEAAVNATALPKCMPGTLEANKSYLYLQEGCARPHPANYSAELCGDGTLAVPPGAHAPEVSARAIEPATLFYCVRTVTYTPLNAPRGDTMRCRLSMRVDDPSATQADMEAAITAGRGLPKCVAGSLTYTERRGYAHEVPAYTASIGASGNMTYLYRFDAGVIDHDTLVGRFTLFHVPEGEATTDALVDAFHAIDVTSTAASREAAAVVYPIEVIVLYDANAPVLPAHVPGEKLDWDALADAGSAGSRVYGEASVYVGGGHADWNPACRAERLEQLTDALLARGNPINTCYPMRVLGVRRVFSPTTLTPAQSRPDYCRQVPLLRFEYTRADGIVPLGVTAPTDAAASDKRKATREPLPADASDKRKVLQATCLTERICGAGRSGATPPVVDVAYTHRVARGGVKTDVVRVLVLGGLAHWRDADAPLEALHALLCALGIDCDAESLVINSYTQLADALAPPPCHLQYTWPAGKFRLATDTWREGDSWETLNLPPSAVATHAHRAMARKRAQAAAVARHMSDVCGGGADCAGGCICDMPALEDCSVPSPTTKTTTPTLVDIAALYAAAGPAHIAAFAPQLLAEAMRAARKHHSALHVPFADARHEQALRAYFAPHNVRLVCWEPWISALRTDYNDRTGVPVIYTLHWGDEDTRAYSASKCVTGERLPCTWFEGSVPDAADGVAYSYAECTSAALTCPSGNL
jgi:hypothetical protein